jgi:LmbE family N-acetylglucosaminyl deacetylase
MNEIRTLALSPHPDDIALSLGGAILSGFFARPILLVSFFTISKYAPFYTGDNTVANISKIRGLEDKAFAQSTGLYLQNMKKPDAPLRNQNQPYSSPLLLMSSLLTGFPKLSRIPGARILRSRMPLNAKSILLRKTARLDRTRLVVADQIRELLLNFPDATILSPLALGNHPDHVVLASICERLESRKSGIYYYEDLPYASKYELRKIERHVKSFDKNLEPVLVPIQSVFEEKIKNLSNYSSQLGSYEINSVTEHAKRLDESGVFERLWTRSTKASLLTRPNLRSKITV